MSKNIYSIHIQAKIRVTLSISSLQGFTLEIDKESFWKID